MRTTKFFYGIIPLILVAVGMYFLFHLIPFSKLTSAEKNIINLSSTLDYVRKHSNFGVFFPTLIPQNKNVTLYATSSSLETPDYNQYWMIMIKTNPKCDNRGCEVGYLSAARDEKLSVDYVQAPFSPDMKSILKEKVILANNITGYYTPGHAEADWHMPSMEWQVGNILYLLTWNIKENAKQALKEMANSGINPAR